MRSYVDFPRKTDKPERLPAKDSEARRNVWLARNRAAIDGYNANVAERGSLGDFMRRF